MSGHGHCAKRGRTPTYNSWRAMRRRCTSPRDRAWSNYGGRGIVVCERWLCSFDAFLADMGERPPGTTLDRVSSDGNYEPGNCRWATKLEQASTQRQAKKLELHEPSQIRWLAGLGFSNVEISRFFEVRPDIVSRIKLGKIWR